MSAISASSAATLPHAYEAAMLKKANQNVREQGQQALQLIESASAGAPAKAASGEVGTQFHVVA